MEQIATPALPWQLVPFEQACSDATGGQTKVQKRDYLTEGLLPVIDQGQQLVAGYSDALDPAYRGPLPVVLFGDHTRTFKYVDFPFALGADGVKVLVAKPPFHPRFLWFYFRSLQIPSRGYSRHFKFLGEFAVPLVAPSEQRRIVAILDQADTLRNLRTAADAKAERILPALFYRMFGEPASWSVEGTSSLGELVDPISGATPSKANPEYWIGSVPWVSPKDMKEEVLGDAEDHVSELAINQSNLKLVPPGTTLIVVRGMILARTVPLAITSATVAINQDMKALVPKTDRVDGLYIYTLLRVLRRQLLGAVATAAHGTRKLDTDLLLSTRVFVPEEGALASFRAAAEEALRLIARQRERQRLLGKLFEVLLHHAFSGDLTAKWREAHMQELLGEMKQQTESLENSRGRPMIDFPDDRAS